ncbi:transposase [Paenibacillus psychroresistens]|uniref:transposase n=1 Tax=Paenibacillus psychroresistens TaxID=1778678 RepID=UPI001391C8AE|nr:transposase [Paenibacillus psychroresistens]
MSILTLLPNIRRVNFTSDLLKDMAALEDFQARFDSEVACANYLFAQKWPHGFICSRCSHTQSTRINTRRLPLYQCNHCHYQVSPIVGTIMESSSTDLRKWFTAMFLVSATESGINALKLSHLIQVTYKTAWLMLRKIRQSITQADDAAKLTGNVYIDNAKFGRPYTGFHYEADEYPVLVGVATDNRDQLDYIKMQIVPESQYDEFHVLSEGIESFCEKHIELDSIVTVTERKRMKRKDMKGYPIFKIARAWLKRTYHGLGQGHLQHYWNEFCWRFNTKLQNNPLFESMLRLCVTTSTTTYAKLLKKGELLA